MTTYRDRLVNAVVLLRSMQEADDALRDSVRAMLDYYKAHDPEMWKRSGLIEMDRALHVADEIRDQAAELLADPGYDEVALRHDPRDTEIRAAEAALPRSGTQRRRVLDAIVSHPLGFADQELETYLAPIRPSSVSARRQELEKDGWIIDSGRRHPSHAGFPCIVWVLSSIGRLRLEQEGVTVPHASATVTAGT